MTTFAAVLERRLRSTPGSPLLTFYDRATGERTELSVTTYANWVAKTASLLAEELDLERGARLVLDLPPHWLGPVFLGAAWTLGLEVAWPEEEPPPDGAAVCGPDTLPRWAPLATDLPVIATALLPLGGRFADPVPPGVHDLGLEVWAQPDAFTAWDPPGDDDLAVPGRTQGDLFGATPGTIGVSDGDRLLSTANPASADGLACFTEALARNGSLVLVRHATPEDLDAVAASERVTTRWP